MSLPSVEDGSAGASRDRPWMLIAILLAEGTYGLFGAALFCTGFGPYFSGFERFTAFEHLRIWIATIALSALVWAGLRLLRSVYRRQWDEALRALNWALVAFLILPVAWYEVLMGVLMTVLVTAHVVQNPGVLADHVGEHLVWLLPILYPAIFVHALYLRFLGIPRLQRSAAA